MPKNFKGTNLILLFGNYKLLIRLDDNKLQKLIRSILAFSLVIDVTFLKKPINVT